LLDITPQLCQLSTNLNIEPAALSAEAPSSEFFELGFNPVRGKGALRLTEMICHAAGGAGASDRPLFNN
ncbi:unnamed protein product, partial [Nesidiocoris tenuis]